MTRIIIITVRLEIKRRNKKRRHGWKWQMTSYAVSTWPPICTHSSTWPLWPPALLPYSEQPDLMHERTRWGTCLHIHTVLTLIPALPNAADVLWGPSNHNRYPSSHLSSLRCHILLSTESRREKPQKTISEPLFGFSLLPTPCWRLLKFEKYTV